MQTAPEARPPQAGGKSKGRGSRRGHRGGARSGGEQRGGEQGARNPQPGKTRVTVYEGTGSGQKSEGGKALILPVVPPGIILSFYKKFSIDNQIVIL